MNKMLNNAIQVHYNIGKMHADMGNTEYAIEKYRHAIRWVRTLLLFATLNKCV